MTSTSKPAPRRAAPALWTLALAASLAACGGGGGGDSAPGGVPPPPPAIVAGADSITLAPGRSADVLGNDTLGGTAATAARVSATTTTALPTGVSFTAAGVLSVGSTTAAGSSSFSYRICQIDVPTNCASADISLTVPAVGTLSGRAIDAATAAGVAGVTVSAGGLTTTTDANGAFSLQAVPAASRMSVNFNSDSHAETSSITSISHARTSDVQVRLVRVAAAADVAVASGGTVTVPGSPAQVVLPANGVQRADGSLPAGNMRVRLTPIDPASDSSVMPGDFTTLVAGTPASIESFGALNVRLSDSAGTALNLRAGQTAQLRIPLGSRNTNPPASIPLFYFDSSSGRWVQEGTATLAGSGSSRYYEGTVGHFSTWNADQVADTIRVSGCVADVLGARVAGAQVATDGIDYSGTSTAVTDASGNFSIAVRRNSQATLVALASGQLTNTLRVGPYAADTTLPACAALGQSSAGVTMKLTWGALPPDLDAHLVTPNGEEVSFSAKGDLLTKPFANLDVDDVSSYGPEVVTITRLMVGTYKYFVVNYERYGSGPIASSSARVELNIPGRPAELFTPPAAGETPSTRVWTLFELDVDAQCNITVRRVPGYLDSQPVLQEETTPVYCTR